jgi:hypothetical protein
MFSFPLPYGFQQVVFNFLNIFGAVKTISNSKDLKPLDEEKVFNLLENVYISITISLFNNYNFFWFKT